MTMFLNLKRLHDARKNAMRMMIVRHFMYQLKFSNACIMYANCTLVQKDMHDPMEWSLHHKRRASKPYFYLKNGDFYQIDRHTCEYEDQSHLDKGIYYTGPIPSLSGSSVSECRLTCTQYNEHKGPNLPPCMTFSFSDNQCTFYSECNPVQKDSSTVYTLYVSKTDFCQGYVNQIPDVNERQNVCVSNDHCFYRNDLCYSKCKQSTQKNSCTCIWNENKCLPKVWTDMETYKRCQNSTQCEGDCTLKSDCIIQKQHIFIKL